MIVILWNYVLKNVWNKLNKEINNLVDSITLEELVQEYKAYKNPGYMYYI